MNFNEEQKNQLKEYLETILDLYTEEEYEEYVEDIIYNYCLNRFGIEREVSVKMFYVLLEEIKDS
ncbi:MAG: hypothetical protein CMG62_00920 [Candidatus Marinimicrobia bacterium]|nr:hypothetical protein [Candidatus Neomarinimicrobiota bacterium]|tara:strand:+ start:105 stop:299 length:195 start_codon:yes stop_codon:yes gene_type:complete